MTKLVSSHDHITHLVNTHCWSFLKNTIVPLKQKSHPYLRRSLKHCYLRGYIQMHLKYTISWVCKIELEISWRKFMRFLAQEGKQESQGTQNYRERKLPLHWEMAFSFQTLLLNIDSFELYFISFSSSFPIFRPSNEVDGERKCLESKLTLHLNLMNKMETVIHMPTP